MPNLSAIRYSSTAEGLRADQLTGFFEGWPSHPSPAMHLEVLKRSDEVVLAIDDSTDAVVGFVTAITDGVLAAYIPLLEVLNAYRGHGIGRALIERIVRQLEPLYMIDLLCHEEVLPFYERCGFRRSPGAVRRDYAVQAGRPNVVRGHGDT